MIRKAGDMKVEKRDNMRGGPGTVELRHLFSKEDFHSKTRLCSRLRLEPGAGIGMHPHDAEEEVFYILKGTGLLNDGQTETPVSEGDAILTGNGASHAITNTGTGPLEIMAIILCY